MSHNTEDAIRSIYSLLAEFEDRASDHLSLVQWAISVKKQVTEVLQALPKDCLSTSLDRTSVNGPGHSTASSGGQDGGNVEMLHEQAQEDTGEEMDVLSSTLDYNSSSGLTDIGYWPNPNLRCNRCIKKRVDCTGGRPGKRCQRCRHDKKGCKFQNYPSSRKPTFPFEIQPPRLHFRRPKAEIMLPHDPTVEVLVKAALEFVDKGGSHSMPK